MKLLAPDAARKSADTLALSTMEALFSSLDGMLFRCKVDEYWTLLAVSAGCHGGAPWPITTS